MKEKATTLRRLAELLWFDPDASSYYRVARVADLGFEHGLQRAVLEVVVRTERVRCVRFHDFIRFLFSLERTTGIHFHVEIRDECVSREDAVHLYIVLYGEKKRFRALEPIVLKARRIIAHDMAARLQRSPRFNPTPRLLRNFLRLGVRLPGAPKSVKGKILEREGPGFR